MNLLNYCTIDIMCTFRLLNFNPLSLCVYGGAGWSDIHCLSIVIENIEESFSSRYLSIHHPMRFCTKATMQKLLLYAMIVTIYRIT